jgi:hypothetical protein
MDFRSITPLPDSFVDQHTTNNKYEHIVSNNTFFQTVTPCKDMTKKDIDGENFTQVLSVLISEHGTIRVSPNCGKLHWRAVYSKRQHSL